MTVTYYKTVPYCRHDNYILYMTVVYYRHDSYILYMSVVYYTHDSYSYTAVPYLAWHHIAHDSNIQS